VSKSSVTVWLEGQPFALLMKDLPGHAGELDEDACTIRFNAASIPTAQAMGEILLHELMHRAYPKHISTARREEMIVATTATRLWGMLHGLGLVDDEGLSALWRDVKGGADNDG